MLLNAHPVLSSTTTVHIGGKLTGVTGRKLTCWQDMLLSLHHYHHHIKCSDCCLITTPHCSQIVEFCRLSAAWNWCRKSYIANKIHPQSKHTLVFIILRKWWSISGSDHQTDNCNSVWLNLTSLYFDLFSSLYFPYAHRLMEVGCWKMSKPTMRQWKVGLESIYRHTTQC